MPWTVYNSAGQLLQATDLVDGTVTASKLDTNAVTNAKVADDAIGVVELSATGTASSSTFLRGDNAWVAAGGLSAASQTEMEASSSNTVAATPGRTQYHPGVAKAWVSYDYGAGTPTVMGSYNISSLGDDGTGHIQVNYDTDLSAAHGATVGLIQAGSPGYTMSGSSQSVGSVDVRVSDANHTVGDFDGSVVIFGDQA